MKELVHGTIIEMPVAKPKEKKKIRYLHIVADEDHVSSQFLKNKGDLPRDTRGYKINTIMPKLICLYEDIINESGEQSKNPRYKLIGKRYFSGVYLGSKANEELWKEVADYIETRYDTDYLERVYIAGDGASWIKTGCEYIENSRFVLDKFHMMKYINASLTQLADSAEDAKSEIWEAVNTANNTAYFSLNVYTERKTFSQRRKNDACRKKRNKENIKKRNCRFFKDTESLFPRADC